LKDLIRRLAAEGPVITDGAWGSLFQARGLGLGELPDSWNLTHPDRVEDVARSYVEAGSRIILTGTFRSNRISLTSHGLADRLVEINRTGVEISRRAADGKALVFASMGSSGKVLMSGEIAEDELREAFAEQARALAEAGADGIAIETMADLEEAKIAVQAALPAGLPVVVTMVFDTGKNKDRTMMGNTPEQAARDLAEAGADVVGANCGQGIEGYIGICRRMRDTVDVPIWIKANAGLPELIGGETVYKTLPEEFASHVPALIDAGATFIGGCCGTTPEFIRAVRHRLQPSV